MPFLTHKPNRAAQPRALGQDSQVIVLPRPGSGSGVSMMTALSSHACMQELARAPLPAKTLLGALLRGADSISRPVTGRRTAPSLHAAQAIHIDAALPNGVYRHDASTQQLTLAHTRPWFLDTPASRRDMTSAVTTRDISKNVSLHTASARLAAVVRGWIDHHLPGDALSPNEDKLPILSQTVGLPAGDAKLQPGA